MTHERELAARAVSVAESILASPRSGPSSSAAAYLLPPLSSLMTPPSTPPATPQLPLRVLAALTITVDEEGKGEGKSPVTDDRRTGHDRRPDSGGSSSSSSTATPSPPSSTSSASSGSATAATPAGAATSAGGGAATTAGGAPSSSSSSSSGSEMHPHLRGGGSSSSSSSSSTPSSSPSALAVAASGISGGSEGGEDVGEDMGEGEMGDMEGGDMEGDDMSVMMGDMSLGGGSSSGGRGENSTHLFIGDLSRTATEDQLRAVFASHGALIHVDIKRDKYTTNNLGYGFVAFRTREEALSAKKALNGVEISGRKIRIGWAQKNTTLFIGDLDGTVSTMQLQNVFRVFGPLIDDETYVKSPSGKFGFVRFQQRADAERAKTEMNRKLLGSRTIRIGWGDNNIQKHCIHVQFNPTQGNHLQETHFRKHFERYGPVVSISLPRYPNRRLKGYGFVHFDDTPEGERAAAHAVESLADTRVSGVAIRCNFGKKQYSRSQNRRNPFMMGPGMGMGMGPSSGLGLSMTGGYSNPAGGSMAPPPGMPSPPSISIAATRGAPSPTLGSPVYGGGGWMMSMSPSWQQAASGMMPPSVSVSGGGGGGVGGGVTYPPPPSVPLSPGHGPLSPIDSAPSPPISHSPSSSSGSSPASIGSPYYSPATSGRRLDMAPPPHSPAYGASGGYYSPPSLYYPSATPYPYPYHSPPATPPGGWRTLTAGARVMPGQGYPAPYSHHPLYTRSHHISLMSAPPHATGGSPAAPSSSSSGSGGDPSGGHVYPAPVDMSHYVPHPVLVAPSSSAGAGAGAVAHAAMHASSSRGGGGGGGAATAAATATAAAPAGGGAAGAGSL